MESTIGVAELDGRLVRAEPRSLGGEDGIAAELAKLTGESPGVTSAALRSVLLGGSQVLDPVTGRPVLAFNSTSSCPAVPVPTPLSNQRTIGS